VTGAGRGASRGWPYRGTSLIRKRPPPSKTPGEGGRLTGVVDGQVDVVADAIAVIGAAIAVARVVAAAPLEGKLPSNKARAASAPGP